MKEFDSKEEANKQDKSQSADDEGWVTVTKRQVLTKYCNNKLIEADRLFIDFNFTYLEISSYIFQCGNKHI